MHQYLKSIGFSEYKTNKAIRELRDEVINTPSRKEVFPMNDDEYYFGYEKDYGECFGICVIKVGITEEDSDYEVMYPYVRGFNYLFNEKFDIDECTEHLGFYGVCDDNNLGIPLIFNINDPIAYMTMEEYHDKENDLNSVTLSGLASEGVILLPIERNDQQKKVEQRANQIRSDMISAAKAGSIEAMEQLTFDEMDTFATVNRRSKREDVFTIVSSYVMPYTVECDKYAVMGEITDLAEMKNKKTGEILYYLSLDCNSIEFEVMINKKDLLGLPQKGRRFKGNVWMQGQMDFL